jgi:hypothetical protein
MKPPRRNFLAQAAASAATWAAAGSGTLGALSTARPLTGSGEESSVRDKLWIWGHVEGSHNSGWGLPGNSRMTPAEGAFYLNVPNLIMVAYASAKEPGKMLPAPPYDPYLISFRPLKRVVWSIVGAGGVVSRYDLEAIRQLAQKYPNIVGVQMDDFFRETLDGGLVGSLTPQELDYVRRQLKLPKRDLSLWVTLYQQGLQHDLAEYLSRVDVVTFWTWQAKDLVSLEENFARAESAAPKARKVLGCYMWDYGDQKPIPIPLMQKQCQLGLEWLRRRRIEGMIFLASCICDLNLDAVEWTRNWIGQVGDEKL